MSYHSDKYILDKVHEHDFKDIRLYLQTFAQARKPSQLEYNAGNRLE